MSPFTILLFLTTVTAKCVIPSNDQCGYIRSECGDIPVLINYLELLYCHNWFYPILAFMVLGIVVIFYLLSISSADHFVPILTLLSKHLSMSADLAGITILAIGNGAPDVFSTFVAIFNTGDFHLATAEVIGSGCFVSCVVVASIVLVNDNIQMPETLIHNISCYIVSLLFVFLICSLGSVGLIHSIVFILIYLLYVIFIGYITRGKPLIKVSEQLDSESRFIDSEDENSGVAKELIQTTDRNNDEEKGKFNLVNESDRTVIPQRQNIIEQIAVANYFNKFLLIISIPFQVVMEYTTPHISDDKKVLLISYVFSPLPFCVVFGLPLKFLIIPFIISAGFVIVLHYTKTDIPVMITNIYGFVISVLYIYIFASELVSLLQSIGVAMRVDSSLLGLTVLCWGNSIGDFVSNVVVSSQGYSEMGIIASYGGPCFNLLIGLGSGVLARSIRNFPQSQNVVMTDTIFFSLMYLIIQLLITLLIITLKGKLTKKYSFVLIGSYVLVLSFSVMSAFNLFKLFG
ncbi:na/ca exchanger, putative [Entamoeba invadens IP1]|uniref:na/ca exchanger, putative n=1 Tax=Entamoeba invadens IP1 TaxID=370355 RepID=UPI0002C3CF28|nr:na/ca exchanger, putative [Entamoeba invadens IP1]ELP85192.1 na/ca exchanger, putative [Entamoeba invadens IP1]|eukprot:XP_004184538.1 na/ca exchanger, putative [Entamoeba invadens IP1]